MDGQALNIVGRSANFLRGMLKENELEEVPVVPAETGIK
jgi:hypothetical protein